MKNWIAVASADHVAIGHAQGFMQVCHGKVAPLRRLQAGDCVVYYSPTQTMASSASSFSSKNKLQNFTAIGTVRESVPYQVEMAPGFCPFRRDVDWLNAPPTSILSLLDQLEFSRGKKNWGYQLRFGLFEISAHDMALIAAAMSTDIKAPTQLQNQQADLLLEILED
ncbi:EVE domain-containing protein [Undibacterium flavidum]|nr:EVE domain-containing protein [Undibacterium flavidum]